MKRIPAPLPVPAKIPLTATAFAEKRALLTRLTTLRAEVMERLKVAREMGDLSENGAYTAAKFELGSINRQLRELRHLLAYAYVPKIMGGSTVTFGSTVSIQGKQGTHTFMLVSQHESDPTKNKLSLESPIGQALLGKKVGDAVTVKTPQGEQQFTIIKIG